jgi:hypothetical protein
MLHVSHPPSAVLLAELFILTTGSDPLTPRALDGASYADSSNMTTESCINFCASNSYVYAGTEYAVRAHRSPFTCELGRKANFECILQAQCCKFIRIASFYSSPLSASHSLLSFLSIITLNPHRPFQKSNQSIHTLN